MGTRSQVGAYTEPNQEGLVLTYCHWDGYPDGVGMAIYSNLKKWEWDCKRMAQFLNSSQCGWSSLAGKDFDIPASWFNGEQFEKPGPDSLVTPNEHGPKWYDDRKGEMGTKKSVNLPSREQYYIEWVYVIDPFSERLYVYEPQSERGIWLGKDESYEAVLDFFDDSDDDE